MPKGGREGGLFIMYKTPKFGQTVIRKSKVTEGETIETKVERIVQNKEPIKDGAPLIFQERTEGVQPAYNIRTDRMEIALDAMDKHSMAKIAEREAKPSVQVGTETNENGDSTTE